MPGLQFPLQCADGLLHRLKLGDEDAQGFTGNGWKPGILRIVNDRNQVLDSRRPLARDHPQLTAMSSYGIEEHRPLFNQQFSRPMKHQHGLLISALDGGKPHSGPDQGLGDGFGIGRIMFIGLEKRADILRRDSSYFVALGLELTGPVMRTATGFHAHYTGGDGRKKL